METVKLNVRVKPGEGGLLANADRNGKLTHKVVREYKPGDPSATGTHKHAAVMTTTEEGGCFERLGSFAKAQLSGKIKGVLEMGKTPDKDGAYQVTGIAKEFSITWAKGVIQGN